MRESWRESKIFAKFFTYARLDLKRKKASFAAVFSPIHGKKCIISMSRLSVSGIISGYKDIYIWEFLFISLELISFHYEKSRTIDHLHGSNDRRIHNWSNSLTFCNTNIEKIFLKWEFSIFYLKWSNIISFCRISIENPDIIHSKKRYHHNSKYIRLSEWESIMLTSSFSLREKRNMSFFCDEDVSVHREFFRFFG